MMAADGGTERTRSDVRWLELDPEPLVIVVAAMVVTLVISVGDYFTGPYLVWATFYLVPVVAVAWFAGRRPALGVAVLGTLAGMVSTALDPGELDVPIIVWNGVFRFVTYAFIAVLVAAERQSMVQIRDQALIDPLTGMLNRRRFYERAEVELARARRNGDALAVVYLDVDDLKLRNDTYGHQAGDAMLVELAGVAAATFRNVDLVARLGGDEFCVLLPNTDLVGAEGTIDRFIAGLARAELLPISVSVGIVSGTVPDGLDVETAVHQADGLMFEAKQSGKGQRRSHPVFGGG